jgi:hypothetical protein
MNVNDKNEMNSNPRAGIGRACQQTCKKVLERIDRAKAAIVSEFRDRVEQHEHVLHLAVNEAEALAWQTEFPELLFPTLAAEKAQEAAAWHARQQSVRRTRSILEYAA